MRAWEFLKERQQEPAISLKRLNYAKRDALRRHAANRDRMAVVGAMYRNLDREKDWIEVDKMRLELEQQRLELERLRSELEGPSNASGDSNPERVKELARAEAERRTKERGKLSDMAVNVLRQERD